MYQVFLYWLKRCFPEQRFLLPQRLKMCFQLNKNKSTSTNLGKSLQSLKFEADLTNGCFVNYCGHILLKVILGYFMFSSIGSFFCKHWLGSLYLDSKEIWEFVCEILHRYLCSSLSLSKFRLYSMLIFNLMKTWLVINEIFSKTAA